jgi:hypothetical protein
MDAETKTKEQLVIHMSISKIKQVPQEPLLIAILTGTEEI